MERGRCVRDLAGIDLVALVFGWAGMGLRDRQGRAVGGGVQRWGATRLGGPFEARLRSQHFV